MAVESLKRGITAGFRKSSELLKVNNLPFEYLPSVGWGAAVLRSYCSRFPFSSVRREGVAYNLCAHSIFVFRLVFFFFFWGGGRLCLFVCLTLFLGGIFKIRFGVVNCLFVRLGQSVLLRDLRPSSLGNVTVSDCLAAVRLSGWLSGCL